MEKKDIRTYVIQKRREIPEEIRMAKSLEITRRIMETQAFSKAEAVYVYMDCKGEVSTKALIEACFSLGKKVAAPKVSGETMDFFWIHSLEDVAPGYFQVPEPTTGEAADAEDALLIVPGVGFDRQRNRCGYGKGFYDRYLSLHSRHTTIGAAFAFQIVDEVPVSKEDIPVRFLVTEERMYASSQDLLEEIGSRAKKAEPLLRTLDTGKKNAVLERAAGLLLSGKNEILRANEKDIRNARERKMKEGLVDRLMLNEARIEGMAEGLRQVAALEDPIGEVLGMKKRPNGLRIGRKRVPLGVIGMIYESRPNVTADAFALCFKTGNAVILKGGSDAIHSNQAIVRLLRQALKDCGVTEDAVLLLESTDRETTAQFMKLKAYVDVLIPRGGAGLIRTVVENSTIPVIETGTGNCHIYVDEGADLSMAVRIIHNAKTQRIGVCNACESLVVHASVERELLSLLKERLQPHHVELRCDERALAYLPEGVKASQEDWGTEYLDYIVSLKLVDSVDEAIAHINTYNTGHSEAIVTSDYFNAQQFLDEVDAAAVYVNASTRFTDGEEFGFGAEIGISTQKLHARGPMGLEALTTTKYIILGDGQIRP